MSLEQWKKIDNITLHEKYMKLKSRKKQKCSFG